MDNKDGELVFNMLDKASKGDEDAKDVLIMAMREFFKDYKEKKVESD